MPQQERSYRSADGRELTLRSERTVVSDSSSWQLTLELYAPGRLRRKLVSRRRVQKSGDWSTSAIVLLQAQEELEILQEAGVEIGLMELI